MTQKSQKYESQLHIGLMAIILVLLMLCTASNFFLYRQRGEERVHVERSLQELSASAARQLNVQSGVIPSDERMKLTRKSLGLTTLSIMPHHLSPVNEAERIAVGTASRFLKDDRDGMTSPLILSESVGELTSGDSSEFLILNQVASDSGLVLVVTGAMFPEYKILVQASDTLFYASLAGLLVLGLLYWKVTRVITAPFARLKDQAERTGRLKEKGADIDSIINDYEQLVAELRERERELQALSQHHQQKADTLENFSRYLMKSLISGVITLDTHGSILSLNGAAATLLGLTHEDWVGQPMSRLPHYCHPILDMVNVTSQSGRNEPYRELRLQSETGKTSPIGITVSAVCDADERCIGYSILLNDLGEVSQLRDELQKREQLAALGEMAGGLAHQLRNALGSARGYSRLVEKKVRAGGDSAESLERLVDELIQTEQLVSRFLDFARPLQPVRDSIDLGRFVEEIMHSFQVREDCKSIRFDVRCPEAVVVSADALLLKQAVANVIENAAKSYQGKQGQVTVRVISALRSVIIEVSDDGVGIEADALPKVFLPFFTTRVEGSGLGLPLAKKIVDLHEGQLSIRSTRGKGTTVRIELPVNCVPVQEPATPAIS